MNFSNKNHKIIVKSKSILKMTRLLVIAVFITNCSSSDDSTSPIVNEATSIELISGENQTEFIGRTLSNPIEVIVKNQEGNPFLGATISFSVTEGAISSQTLITNSEGKASVNWTLGETIGNQVLTVSSFVDGVPLNSSPISVSATALNPCITQSNTGNFPINFFTDANSTINITNSFIISDVNVTINIEHTFNDDLIIFLVGPTASIELSSRNGGSSNNYLNTVFDDDADTSITGGSGPFTGSFQPENPLSTFNGMDSSGNWTLIIIDDVFGVFSESDTGALLDWSIELCQ